MAPRDRTAAALPRLLIVVILVALLSPGPAAARPGSVAVTGCLGDASGDVPIGECADSVEVLAGPTATTISPDGRYAFTASILDASVVMSARDQESGALTPIGCIADPDVTSSATYCGRTAQGLTGAQAIATSRDGSEIYVAAGAGVVRLGVESTGLRDLGCISMSDAGCSTDPDLRNVVRIVRHGGDLYVLAVFGNALIRLRPTGPTGLARVGCATRTGRDGCTTAPLLIQPQDLVVSPDGRHVYVAVQRGVMRFDVGAGGRLEPVGCQSRDLSGPRPALVSCSAGRTLSNWRSIVISPDGRDVYLGALSEVVHLRRTPNGRLTLQDCVLDDEARETEGDRCATTAPALRGITELAMDPDGDEVVVSAQLDDALTRLRRLRGGELSPAGCVSDSTDGTPTNSVCSATAVGLDGAWKPSISPDGRSIYVSSSVDYAVTSLRRAVTRPSLTLAGADAQRRGRAAAVLTTDGFSRGRLTGTFTVRGATARPVRLAMASVDVALTPGASGRLPLRAVDMSRLRTLLTRHGATATLTVRARATNSQGTTTQVRSIAIRR